MQKPISEKKIQPGCTAEAKGDCENCAISREIKGMLEFDPEILKHMGEAGCIIAEEEAEAFWSEVETAEAEQEEEMARQYEESADGEWENDDDDLDYDDCDPDYEIQSSGNRLESPRPYQRPSTVFGRLGKGISTDGR